MGCQHDGRPSRQTAGAAAPEHAPALGVRARRAAARRNRAVRHLGVDRAGADARAGRSRGARRDAGTLASRRARSGPRRDVGRGCGGARGGAREFASPHGAPLPSQPHRPDDARGCLRAAPGRWGRRCVLAGPPGDADRSRTGVASGMIDALRSDLRYAVRTLRKSPGFAAAAILTLALAIGSNTAVFSVVNSVLLRPLPFAEQDRLFMLAEQSRQGGFRPPSYPTFLDWQAQSSAFVDLAYVRGGGQRLAGPEGVQSVIVSVVSPGFFATLSERPLVGRLFTPDEEKTGAHVAVLSYGLWRGRFGGDPHILGTTLSLSSGVSTVVGVLPHDVGYPPWADEQLYMPIATVAATERVLTQRGFHADCRIIGRLKPGVTAEQAKAQLDGVAQREAIAYPGFNADWTSVRFIPLHEEILGATKPQLLVLVAAV